MENVFSVGFDHFLSPPILCFLLGMFASFIKSDLYVPDQLGKGLALFLMISIGLQGGALVKNSVWSAQMSFSLCLAVLLSFLIPFVCRSILKRVSNQSDQEIALISAHYGSISIVTLMTALEFLKKSNIPYENSVIPMAALMETPAILAGFFLMHKTLGKNLQKKSLLLREVFLNGAIILLLGGFLIGFISSSESLKSTLPFFSWPFKGVLCFFLLDLGIKVASQASNFKKISLPLLLFGIYMPIIGAIIGSLLSALIGLEIGTCIVLGVLTSSASYIAVPAAMQTAFPDLDNSKSITLSLNITFPFNIFIGIPLYTYIVLNCYDVVSSFGLGR
ncbi:sodium-dependent bicarbonate transport family permease [Alphaproteobacteria bacterium]|nr:sodium-dependent bicarbonate transport family permease [Alphaproteobacteria bacterium]